MSTRQVSRHRASLLSSHKTHTSKDSPISCFLRIRLELAVALCGVPGFPEPGREIGPLLGVVALGVREGGIVVAIDGVERR
jgi:hypothetical protein